MSLVLCYHAVGGQIWCSDGRTVFPTEHQFVQTDHQVRKIRCLPNSSIICGWVGEKYDAEKIIDNIRWRPSSSVQSQLVRIANSCRIVNDLSRAFCGRRDQVFCPTGLLIGGYTGGTGFLSVVTPDGLIERKERFAAIGIGAKVASRCLSEIGEHPLLLIEALDVLLDTMTEACRDSEFVGVQRYCLAVASGCHIELPLMGNSSGQQVYAHGRELLRRFALQFR